MGRITGSLDPKVLSIYRNAKKRKEIDELRRWAKERSAITYIEEINNNQPAIYLSQNYKDQLFSVNQIIHFFDKLTTPKKLVTHRGIHASAEVKGLLGMRSEVWTPAFDWLDHWLLDKENNVVEGVIEYNRLIMEKNMLKEDMNVAKSL